MTGLSSKMPPGEDWVPRALKQLEAALRQLVASVANSIQPQVAYLLTQEASAEMWNIPYTEGVGVVTVSPATSTGIVWLAFNAAYDASLTFTTSSTGKVSVLISGQLAARSTGTAYGEAFFGLEILQAGTPIDSPSAGDGPGVEIQGGHLSLTTAGCPYLTENYVPLAPNTEYVFRTRRGYRMSAGSGSDMARASWMGSVITVTKLGM